MSISIPSRLLLAIVVCTTTTHVAGFGLEAAPEALRGRGDGRRAAWVGNRRASELFDAMPPAVPPQLLVQWRATYNAIDDAVRHTGGSLHHVRTGADAYQRILDEYRHTYQLRYTPRGVGRAGWHDISVKITRPGSYTVRARKGYEGR